MLIAQIINDQITVGEYKTLFPDTSFADTGPTADFLEQNGCLPVTMWKSHNSATEKLVTTAPYIENAQVYTVQVQALSADDIQAKLDGQITQARAQRDQLLKNSDWTQGKDIADAVSVPWAQYRQLLRDVPAQAGFPLDITWPTEPGSSE